MMMTRCSTMPEGDTIFRAAQTLQKAFAGKRVERFETVFPQLSRVDADAPIAGRTIDRVSAVGKHLLITFSGALTLRTHMRMNGSWHIYRRGERWHKSRHSMRIIIETADFEAVGFNIPEAEFVDPSTARELVRLGPDLLAPSFDLDKAVERMEALGGDEIADVLLNQTVATGIGNVFKSEILFVCRINPFVKSGELSRAQLAQLMATARKQLRENVLEAPEAKMRRTTMRSNPAERLWVYGRGSRPCRVCGTAVKRQLQGRHSRPTYWCPSCQAAGGKP